MMTATRPRAGDSAPVKSYTAGPATATSEETDELATSDDLQRGARDLDDERRR